MRLISRHPLTTTEEIRLRKHESRQRLQKQGIFRAFDVKPPAIPDRPRASGRGHHRVHWPVDKLLKAENEVFDELPPVISATEKKLYNSLLSVQEKTSRGTVTTNALKQHLVARSLALNVLLTSKRRPIITYLDKLLSKANVPPPLYEQEITALLILENLLLKEHEFHFAAGANIANPSNTSKEKLYDAISAHFDEIALEKQTDDKAPPPELQGPAHDVFEGSSASTWLKRQINFSFDTQGNQKAPSKGRKNKRASRGKAGRG